MLEESEDEELGVLLVGDAAEGREMRGEGVGEVVAVVSCGMDVGVELQEGGGLVEV